MNKRTYLSLLSSLAILAFLPGCSVDNSAMNAQSKSNHSTKVTNSSPNATPSSTQAKSLAVSNTHKAQSSMVFTLNQPIEDVHVVSGKPSLLIGKSSNSVTFRRGQSSSQTVTVMVTMANGKEQQLTLTIPKAPMLQETDTHKSGSPSNSPSATAKVYGTAAPIIYFGPSSGRRIYITVDDGWFTSQKVLHLMQTQHVPITTFLIQKAATEHLSYWKAFVKAGGVIQDHTVNHPWLTKISYQNDISQWSGPVQNFPKWFGQTPSLGRPPYGAVNKTVQIAAHEAGLKDIVMWSAAFNPTHPSKGLQTWNNKPLSPGEIVILHWDPGLYNRIEQLLKICKERNLVPAPLVFTKSTTNSVYGKTAQPSFASKVGE